MFDYKGFGESALTFGTAEKEIAGKALTVVANDKVAISAEGDSFCGVGLSVRGDIATVQMGGYCQLPYEGSAPSLGVCARAAAKNGAVKSADTGRTVTVLNVDTEKQLVGFIF